MKSTKKILSKKQIRVIQMSSNFQFPANFHLKIVSNLTQVFIELYLDLDELCNDVRYQIHSVVIMEGDGLKDIQNKKFSKEKYFSQCIINLSLLSNYNKHNSESIL